MPHPPDFVMKPCIISLQKKSSTNPVILKNSSAGAASTSHLPHKIVFIRAANGQLFTALTNWVEAGTAPATITLQSADASASQLLCPYPQKPTYSGTGAVTAAASYSCK